MVAVVAVVTGCSGDPHSGVTVLGPGGVLGNPIQSVVAERDRAGDRSWNHLEVGRQHELEGYTVPDSVVAGHPVRMFVSTTFRRFRVVAFRMGWYRGALARRVWMSPWLPGRRQHAVTVTGLRNLPAAPWMPSLTVDTAGWVPGDYLLRLDSNVGTHRRFVPLTVRTPSARGAVVLVNADTTWQAYNAWGGYSLYHGPDGLRSDRARAVSFDRPYDYGDGAADFLANELPVVALAERLGVRLDYVTDVDLHRDPGLLDGARAVISLGHDEYWSPAMRRAVTAARAHGTNIAFLGANAVYRKIRFRNGPHGADRIEINYKDDTDPIGRTDPAQVTTQWRSPPSNDPESSLTGALYRCNPVHATMVVTDAANWLLRGIVHNGERIPGLIGAEYDRVDRDAPTPQNITVLTHSPVICDGQRDYSDSAYYSTRSGAGVFDAGTGSWICPLKAGGCPQDRHSRRATRVVTAITARLIRRFAAGPAASPGRRGGIGGCAARYGRAADDAIVHALCRATTIDAGGLGLSPPR